MLAVAIATATLRALSYGNIYHTKLLRRGRDIDRAGPWRTFGDLTAADAMRPFPVPLAVPDSHDNGVDSSAAGRAPLPGRIIYEGNSRSAARLKPAVRWMSGIHMAPWVNFCSQFTTRKGGRFVPHTVMTIFPRAWPPSRYRIASRASLSG